MPDELPFRDAALLRGRTGVFADRDEAGRLLAALLEDLRGSDALVLGVPAGGLPVAAALARELGLPLAPCVVSKPTAPWSTEVGLGAVAFDGSILLNQDLIQRAEIHPVVVEERVEEAQAKVRRRLRELTGDEGVPAVRGRTVVLVDDGLASGFTMRAAVAAVQRAGARRVVVAVPTAHRDAAETLAGEADEVVVANLRAGPSFAVADAYAAWRDVGDDEARAALEAAASRS